MVWERQDTVKYQVSQLSCVDIQDNIQMALTEALQNNADFQVMYSPFPVREKKEAWGDGVVLCVFHGTWTKGYLGS